MPNFGTDVKMETNREKKRRVESSQETSKEIVRYLNHVSDALWGTAGQP